MLLRLVAQFHSPLVRFGKRHFSYENDSVGQKAPIGYSIMNILGIFGIRYEVISTFVHTHILYILYLMDILCILYMRIHIHTVLLRLDWHVRIDTVCVVAFVFDHRAIVWLFLLGLIVYV